MHLPSPLSPSHRPRLRCSWQRVHLLGALKLLFSPSKPSRSAASSIYLTNLHMGQPVEVAKAPCVQLGWHKRLRARCRPPRHIISSPGGFLGQGSQIWRNFTRKEHCGGVFWSLASPRAEQAGAGTFSRLQNPPKVPKTPKVASQACSRGGYSWWNDAPWREGR